MLILMSAALPAKKQTLHSGRNSIMCAGGGANQWGRVGEQGESQQGKGRKEDETGRGGGINLVHIQSQSLESSVGAVR